MQKAFQFFGHPLLPTLLLEHVELLFQLSQALAVARGCDRQGRSHGCWRWLESYQHPSASHSRADDGCAFDLLHQAYTAIKLPVMWMTRRMKQLEYVFEKALWRLRLISILPVAMSLISSIATFAMGTKEIFKSLALIDNNHFNENLAGALLGGIIGGIDLYLVGIALLIFGYGVYELIISPIEPARSADGLGNGLLDIRNLDQLKEKLVKVLVVALIVSAFKAMMTLPIDSPTSLALFCLSVLLLALSGWLVAAHSKGEQKLLR